jgi:aminocarboxymuconate-semialdehyde decarboxylase
MYICGDDRLDGHDLLNAVGRPTETTIAMARLLFSGHLTRFPGVPLVVSHGGGALPYALGRLRCNRAIHRDGCADSLVGFRRLYFDTVLFEPQALRSLCDVAGSDRVVLGSDYPFPIGDSDRLGLSTRRHSPAWNGASSSAKPPRAFFTSTACASDC